jgi:PAS domain S-box-containing protein
VTTSSRSPRQYTAFVRDLSLIKEAERGRTRMQTILSKAEELVGVGSFELDLRTLELVWSDELFRISGYEPGQIVPTLELAIQRLHPDDRPEIEEFVREMIASPRPIQAEYRIQHDDGTIRHVIVDGAIETGEDGEPSAMIGAIQDVTETRLSERDLQAHYALTQTLSDWHSFDEGVVDLLRRIGTAMDWDAACMLVRADRGEDLVCRAVWSSPTVDLSEFEHSVREVRLKPGESVIGQSWERMEPLSVVDMSSDDRLVDTGARTAALAAGLRSAVVFPAVHDGEVLAVLTLNGTEPRELSSRLIQTLASLGRDIGRFLDGRRAEIGLRNLSPRELEVLRLAADGLSAPLIAEQLMIGAATVKTHFTHIYEKLGVTDRSAAVAVAMRQGLID